ncbi:MAG TPA: hypothetical protein VGR35_10675 [Tepidisphaeraceae bacterium]|nr:hypothetical protein [Tepidisphaeraceae bacterium]
MLYAILFVLLLLLILPYVIVTLLAHGQVTLNGNPIMSSLAPDDLPEDVVQHFVKPAQALGTNGFEPTAYFSIANYAPDTFTFVALWTSAQASDVATVMVHLGGGRGLFARMQTLVYTDFYTLFDNGVLILTSNNPETPWFKSVPGRDVVQLRDVESAAVVYRLHQSRAIRLAPPGIGKFVPRAGEEMTWYRQLLADQLRQQQEAGYLEPAEQEQQYRPTWLGALVISTVMVPPVSRIRRWQMSEKAEAELKLARGPVRGVL